MALRIKYILCKTCDKDAHFVIAGERCPGCKNTIDFEGRPAAPAVMIRQNPGDIHGPGVPKGYLASLGERVPANASWNYVEQRAAQLGRKVIYATQRYRQGQGRKVTVN